MTGVDATPKTVKPGKVTGIWWESRAKYEEEVNKVVMLTQTLTEIRARTIEAQSESKNNENLEWIRAKIDELIPSGAEQPTVDEENKSPKRIWLDVELSLDRYNTLRKTAEPFTLTVQEDAMQMERGSESAHLWADVDKLVVTGTGAGALDLSTLPEMPNLQELHLDQCGLNSLSDFPTARLPALKILGLTESPKLQLGTLPTLPNLKKLFLLSNGITTLATLTAARLPKLTDLFLNGNPKLDLSTLPDLPKLEDLKVAHCEIKTLEHLTLARYPVLRFVEARHNPDLSSETVPKETTERLGKSYIKI